MKLLIFFPEKRREPVLGGLDSAFTKNLRFAAKAVQCSGGVKGESAWPQDRELSAAGIALTWAAKPRLSQSLNP